MKLTLVKPLFACVIPAILLAGCGGVTEDINNLSNELASALPEGEQTTSPQSGNGTPANGGARVISGRVADGYLQGATVCVDLNENGSCDADEPTATTTAGGNYTINVGDNADNKPIIADVPPEAIDEDTGLPIGKRLLLSTLADRSEFISPLTTMVVEELNNNPGLSKDDAEDIVKDVLGLNEGDGASLFTDYVASQKEGDSENRDRYRYLHQTARVVASMMDEVQAQVESAAIDEGVDVSGDDATRLAIRQLVRQEVRDLLPEISLAVAEKIAEQQAANENGERPTIVEEVDATNVAELLISDHLESKIVERLEAIREQHEAQAISMKTLLTEGMYWLESGCGRYDSYPEGVMVPEVQPVEIMMNDEGIPTPIDMSADCFAEYGFITVEGEDNLFSETRYYYDAELGTWIEDFVETESDPFAFTLSNGKWIEIKNDGPSGPVAFQADGSAVVSSDFGEFVVHGNTRKLDNLPVKEYLYFDHKEGVNERIKGDASGEVATFPEGSAAHRLHIKRSAMNPVLFNWYPQDDDYNANTCDEFGGNCNVIDMRYMTDVGDTVEPVTSLDQLLNEATYGIDVMGISHHYEGYPIDLYLTANETATAGTAVWYLVHHYENEGGIGYADCHPGTPAEGQPGEIFDDQEFTAETVEELPPCIDIAQVENPDGQYVECYPTLADAVVGPDGKPLPDETTVPYPGQEPLPGDCVQPFADDQSVGEFYPGIADTDQQKERVLGETTWKLITIDGVEMIDLGLPMAVKHSIDVPEASSLLLIEHEGFVRRGAKLGGISIDTELTWSETAFKTLQPIVEDFVNQ